MIRRMIKPSVCVINLNLQLWLTMENFGLDNSSYHAQLLSIIAKYLFISSLGLVTKLHDTTTRQVYDHENQVFNHYTAKNAQVVTSLLTSCDNLLQQANIRNSGCVMACDGCCSTSSEALS